MVLVGLKLTTRQWRELSLPQCTWLFISSISIILISLSIDCEPANVCSSFVSGLSTFHWFILFVYLTQPIYTFVNGFLVHLVPFGPFRMHLYFCEVSIYSWQYLVLLELNLVSPRLFLRYNLWVCSQMGPRFIFCFIFYSFDFTRSMF